MKILHPVSTAIVAMGKVRPLHRKSIAAFTMVEIALCLAIIGFAVVAIIGVLPTGMEVQRVNRQETVINQDAAVWFDAIRNGAHGYDDLTNYVIAITNTRTVYNVSGSVTTLVETATHVFTRDGWTIDGAPRNPAFPLTNGSHIIGLLSMPKIVSSQTGFISNNVVAAVRALSGTVLDKAPQNNEELLESAFAYRLIAEVVPYVPVDPGATNFGLFDPNIPAEREEFLARSNYWRIVTTLRTNSYDIRLRFRWPLHPTGKAGNENQTFRLLVGGQLRTTNLYTGAPDAYFLQPSTYVKTRFQ